MACCLPNDLGCDDRFTRAECLFQGGTHLNVPCEFADCNSFPPLPKGACCLPDGTCELLNLIECGIDRQGTYNGDGVPCEQAPCSPPPPALPDRCRGRRKGTWRKRNTRWTPNQCANVMMQPTLSGTTTYLERVVISQPLTAWLQSGPNWRLIWIDGYPNPSPPVAFYVNGVAYERKDPYFTIDGPNQWAYEPTQEWLFARLPTDPNVFPGNRYTYEYEYEATANVGSPRLISTHKVRAFAEDPYSGHDPCRYHMGDLMLDQHWNGVGAWCNTNNLQGPVPEWTLADMFVAPARADPSGLVRGGDAYFMGGTRTPQWAELMYRSHKIRCNRPA